jgi:hypothetical protein
MTGRIIQGFFPAGGPRPLPGSRIALPLQAKPGGRAGIPGPPGPPPRAFAGNTVAQRFGGDGNFAVDPVQLGLARSGGSPLPGALLAKMEAAFGADFSAVRVHVGPQAARIGAVAFTTGNDLYFAPGRYQPDSVQGQQLIGHELAHVIQQRQGRVRAPGGGVAVVQDHALEAEADRLGMRAAMRQGRAGAPGHRVQLKPAHAGQAPKPATKASGGCGCGGEGNSCGSLPTNVQAQINAIARSGDIIRSQKAFSRALPGMISQMKRHHASQAADTHGTCGCGGGGGGGGGGCGCGSSKGSTATSGRPIQGKGIIQAANCRRVVNGHNQDMEWYTRTGAQVRNQIANHTGMHIDNDIAHTLCCAFCEAQIRTFAEGGEAVGPIIARYTQLFEHYVHEYSAASAVAQNVFTEEAYWIPTNAANFGASLGLLAPHANAHLYDNAGWAAVRARLLALIAGMVGATPTGLPLGDQAAFTAHAAALAAEAVPAAVAAGGRRRSYAGGMIRLSALYNFLHFISHTAPAIAAPSEWHGFRDLSGRLRILDFTGESAGGQPAVVDAKFSYGNGFDVFGAGQAADLLTVHQSLPGGPGPAHDVPAITWHLCGCNQDLLNRMLFDQMKKKIEQSEGKRNAESRKERARADYETGSKKTKFISSTDVKWVKS